MTRNAVKITVFENGIEESIETYIGEYHNLMELLKDKRYLYCFGECGGMGRCATCIIRISNLDGNSQIKERNEPATLTKFGYEEDEIRLSCQILISSDLDGATIRILE